MTCFWDSMRRKLNLGIDNPGLVRELKEGNTKCISVLWNGSELTAKQKEENFEHVRDFDVGTIHRGYDCSICDPFMILLCQMKKCQKNTGCTTHPMRLDAKIQNHFVYIKWVKSHQEWDIRDSLMQCNLTRTMLQQRSL